MAKQSLPSTLSDLNAFFANESWAGALNKVKLLDIELKTETFTAGGTGVERDKVLPILKALKTTMTWSDYSSKVLSMVGNPNAANEPIILRGSFNRDGTELGIKIKMQGDFFKQSFNEMATGGVEATTETDVSLSFYSVEIDGDEAIYVDADNRVFRTGGTDHWEQIRSNLGM